MSLFLYSYIPSPVIIHYDTKNKKYTKFKNTAYDLTPSRNARFSPCTLKSQHQLDWEATKMPVTLGNMGFDFCLSQARQGILPPVIRVTAYLIDYLPLIGTAVGDDIG